MASNLGNRVTSAPYRFPEQTPSQYHAKCASIPGQTRAKSARLTPAMVTYDEAQKHSNVVQDEIWKKSCVKEKSRGMKWEQTWGFLAKYDQKGNLKEPKQYDEHDKSLYSITAPNTSNGHYGRRVNSANSSFIQRLERTPHNLRKNKEVLYCE